MAALPSQLRQDRGLDTLQAGTYRPLGQPGCHGAWAGPRGTQEGSRGLACSGTLKFQGAQGK